SKEFSTSVVKLLLSSCSGFKFSFVQENKKNPMLANKKIDLKFFIVKIQNLTPTISGFGYPDSLVYNRLINEPNKAKKKKNITAKLFKNKALCYSVDNVPYLLLTARLIPRQPYNSTHFQQLQNHVENL